MKTYPRLYKKTATGATQVWWMDLDGDRYRSHSGQLDGAITSTEWTRADPKNTGRANATTGAEQAEKEVEAEYVLKGKKRYRETAEDAHEVKTFQPMLARKYQDEREKYWGAKGHKFVQPKLDGVRCLLSAKGMFARTGAPILTAPHVMEAMAGLLEQYPDRVFDGELYNHEYAADFNALISAIKTSPDAEALKKSAEMIKYYIYDWYDPNNEPCGFANRARFMQPDIMYDLGDSVVLVETLEIVFQDVKTAEEIGDEYYEHALHQGYEGAMYRLDTPYEVGKRSKALLKRKTMLDAEFPVLDILPGRGNAEKLAKIAVVKLPNGNKARADIVGTAAELKHLLNNRALLIGKDATVMFQGWTPDKSIRFPKLKLIHVKEKW